MSSSNNLTNQSQITHNNNQLTNNVIQYIQSANNYLDILIDSKNNISISNEHIIKLKRLATALKLLDSLWFSKNKVHSKLSLDFNFAYLKKILNHNLSQLKSIAIVNKDKLIIELIQWEEKMIAKIG